MGMSVKENQDEYFPLMNGPLKRPSWQNRY